MIRGTFISLIFIYVTCFFAEGQTTSRFKTIDAKHAFKDVVFGTTLNLVKIKMGLEQDGNEKTLNQFFISDKKYLSVGRYTAALGIAAFSKNRFQSVSLFITLDESVTFFEVLNYFTDLFGVPEMRGNYYTWAGKKITYDLLNDSKGSKVMVTVESTVIQYDNGEDNF